MEAITLSWAEFLKEAEQFVKLSKKFDDDWELFEKNENEGNTFLICKKKIRIENCLNSAQRTENLNSSSDPKRDVSAAACSATKSEILLMEYHIVYSISYQVPVLYVKAQHCDGSMLEMEDLWSILGTNEDINSKSRDDMLTVLTQMEHTVLFKPFYAIHPCRTTELLGHTPKSRNKVLTFISLMGPYIKLSLDNRYGLEVEEVRETN